MNPEVNPEVNDEQGDESITGAPIADEQPDIRLFRHPFMQALFATGVGVAVAVFGYLVKQRTLNESLFLLVPLLSGFSIAWVTNGIRVGVVVSLTSLVMSCGILLATGLEGIPCVVMAFPILLGGIGIGAGIGVVVCRRFIRGYGRGLILLVGFGAIVLGGAVAPELRPRHELVTTTERWFAASPEVCHDSIRSARTIEGDSWLLEWLHLPVPRSCSVNAVGKRVCHFDQGDMTQQIVSEVSGEHIDLVVSGCDFTVRKWLHFRSARYELIPDGAGTLVIRHTVVESELEPRWYWSWFERQAVAAEHDYVLESMRRAAEAR